jgi:Tfp pilus assembly protein PilV
VERGTTLIEVIAAVAVMIIGAAGLAGIHKMGMRMEGDGRRITRATAIAEDLAQQIALWPYNDARLSNPNPDNDDNIGDLGLLLESNDPANWGPAIDHGEADLTAGGYVYNGIPATELLGYERYWNVSFNDPANPGTLLDYNGNSVPDAVRVAVIVRYRTDVGWRRIVVLVTKISDQNNR